MQRRRIPVARHRSAIARSISVATPTPLLGADTRAAGRVGETARCPGCRVYLTISRSRVFSYYNKYVELHDSARKHGVADQDIVHAIDHALAIEDAGEDPDRWLLIGPDTAGNLLEVVVLITAEGTQIVIHAMPMRDKYARLLEQ